MVEIRQYEPAHRREWDEFVSRSKNATFLFFRDYMDYHNDRFSDCSLMCYEKGRLLAVFPANVSGNTVFSHQGLTYGGLLMSVRNTAVQVLEIFDSIFSWYRQRGIRELIYKCIPWIYHLYPAEEDLYGLFRHEARLIARNISTAVDLSNPLGYNELRKRCIRRALQALLRVEERTDFSGFWTILTENLSVRHGVAPVHTLPEITRLHACFPDRIRHFVATNPDGEMMAGCVVYETAFTVHVQYISTAETGRSCGALDLLFDRLIRDIFPRKRFLEFGQSTEQGGRYLNEGLIGQKEGFGGRAVVYDTYAISL